MVITKKYYVAPITPEAIYMQWLNLTVSPMSISDDLPHDPLCNTSQHQKHYSWPKFLVTKNKSEGLGNWYTCGEMY